MALSDKGKEILLEASRLIHTDGTWMKGSFHGFNYQKEVPTYCSLGAVQRASANLGWGFHCDAELEVEGILHKYQKGQWMRRTIVEFNDDFSTTEKDVRDLFCRAVKGEIPDDDTR